MQPYIEQLIQSVALLQRVPSLVIYVVLMGVACGVIFGYVSVMAMVMIYAERKVAGHMQARYGPMRVGPRGILQSIADAIKLLLKEDIVPAHAEGFLFKLAPLLVFAGAFVPFVALPFSERLVISKMNVGVFFVLSLLALEVIGIIMAGWASSNKWALYGGMRLAAQMISYEIPLGLSVLTVIAFSQSLTLNDVTHAQSASPWLWFASPLRSPFTSAAFLLFFIASLAASKRLPFDLPEAESELVAGFHTEYSGMRFAYFFFAEYTAMYVFSALAAILFLGGWLGPLPAPLGLLNMLGKTYFLLFVMLWLRWTLPRLRIDQVMHTCLKYLLPISIVCFLGAALQAVLVK
jgi:NADH-quinone oxidoreductase subunit H